LSAGVLRVQVPSSPPFYRNVAQSLERPAWDREAAGENPAIPTNFNLLPWSNISGIRLLSEIMQVRILPAAPLPDSVKVARRPVKPRGVGASPTLAANFWKAVRHGGRAQAPGCTGLENRIGIAEVGALPRLSASLRDCLKTARLDF
jgi:hypothetical protein